MTLDEELVAAIRKDYRTAPIDERDRVMLDYVAKLTRDATRDHAGSPRPPPRSAGFDDRGILQITLIASWFNYINRVADALGVGRGSSAEVSPRLGRGAPSVIRKPQRRP